MIGQTSLSKLVKSLAQFVKRKLVRNSGRGILLCPHEGNFLKPHLMSFEVVVATGASTLHEELISAKRTDEERNLKQPEHNF